MHLIKTSEVGVAYLNIWFGLLLTVEVKVNTMERSKELPEASRKMIAEAYKSDKGFKKISKEC